MAKKLVSSAAIIHKKKPIIMKNSTKKKRFFKKVLQYLKSDLYMFAPLLSTHSNSLSTGDEANETWGDKEKKKLHNGVVEYMKSDCYMYAPLVTPQPSLYASTSTSKYAESELIKKLSHDNSELVKKVSHDINSELVKKISHDNIELMKKVSHDKEGKNEKSNQHLNVNNYPRSSSIRRSILQRETVKHIVHGKFRSPSVPGKGSVEAEVRISPRKLVTK